MSVDPHARVYVAGHRGLIGAAVTRLARRAQANVIVRARNELDLRDAAAVERFFAEERPEYVVLAAGRVGGIVANRDFPGDFISENLAVELNVLQSAQRTGARRVIFFASSCMYPRAAPQPMGESLLFEGKPEETSIAYAVAKLAGTELCLAYNRQYGGQRFVPLIPNSVYGEGDNFDPASGHVLAALIGRFHAAKATAAPSVTLWGSGTPRRELLHADDLARACWLVLGADLSAMELPINIGPGEDISVRDLAALVARVVGYQGALHWDTSRPDGAPRKLLDSARVRSLGWRPEVELEAGIRRTYEWYREHHAAKATT